MRPRAAITALEGGASRIVTCRERTASAASCSVRERPTWGRARTSRTSSRMYSFATSSQTPRRPRSKRRLSFPSDTSPPTRAFASTNSFTVPLLPDRAPGLVHELAHARAGQAALLDLLADRLQNLVLLPQPADHHGPPEEGDLHVLASLQAQALPNLLRQGELSRGRDLADARFHEII